jgi:CRP-like cAMP-binding protein
LPVSLVRAVVHQHPDVYVRVIESIGVRMRLLMEWTGQSVMLAPEQRMAKLLHVLARVRGAVDGNRAVLPITQAQLARLARCSRQSANLLLRALERRALIRSAYGRYEIDDMTALDAFTERDDQGLG